jgi:cytochrome c556
MRFGVGVAVLLSLVAFAGVAVGQDDPIAARQKLMKMNNAELRGAFNMATGKTPYDATQAADAMNQIAADLDQFVTLFPEGSTSPTSGASPDIWTNMDDFKALAMQLQTDAKAAAAVAPNGADAFKAAVITVNGGCTACHKKYRAEQQ